MTPKVSVITPTVRGLKNLITLTNDFKNQTAINFLEHIIVYDGKPPEEVSDFMSFWQKEHPYTRFFSIDKDMGNMKTSPGTRPRNFGIFKALGEYVVFFDDDDRAKDTYVETLMSGSADDIIAIVQMSCQESRMAKNGDPTRIRLIPELGLPYFPIICHVGTPCFIVKREWAMAEPWRDEPEHDFRFINRICDRFKPRINLIPGMQVDVDSKVIGNLQDWVSIPPFYRS